MTSVRCQYTTNIQSTASGESVTVATRHNYVILTSHLFGILRGVMHVVACGDLYVGHTDSVDLVTLTFHLLT